MFHSEKYNYDTLGKEYKKKISLIRQFSFNYSLLSSRTVLLLTEGAGGVIEHLPCVLS
jgi:hypothetical protein